MPECDIVNIAGKIYESLLVGSQCHYIKMHNFIADFFFIIIWITYLDVNFINIV